MDYLDKNKRTLDEASQTAELSEAAFAFVNAGAVNSRARRSTAAPKEIPAVDIAKSNAVEIPFTAAIPGTVSMTFRLPTELSTRLIRASVERKLRRERPFSQQDILAEALAQWFKRNT